MTRRYSKDATTHRRDGLFSDGLLACALVLAWHVGLGWGLARLLAVPPASRPQALQVTWIEPRAPLSITRLPPRSEGPKLRPAPVRTNEHRPPPPVATELSSSPAVEAVAPPRPVPADLAAQARAWVEDQVPVSIAAADPLTRVRPSLPGRSAHRFRETPPRSPAEMVALVGVMFGGGGPGACEEISAAITGQVVDSSTDATALALALEFERRKCRP